MFSSNCKYNFTLVKIATIIDIPQVLTDTSSCDRKAPAPTLKEEERTDTTITGISKYLL